MGVGSVLTKYALSSHFIDKLKDIGLHELRDDAHQHSKRLALWIEPLSECTRLVRSVTVDLQICDDLYFDYYHDGAEDRIVATDITDKRNLLGQ